MKQFKTQFPIILFIVILTLAGCSDQPLTQHNNPPPNDQEAAAEADGIEMTNNAEKAKDRFIVMFKEQPTQVVDAQTAQLAVAQTGNILTAANIPQDSVIHQYKWASRGFAGRFTEEQVRRLQEHPLVEHVVKDVYYKAIQYRESHKNTSSANLKVSQSMPWGISRVNGPLSGATNTAWIIDTGIDVDHPDLNVDQSRTVSFLTNEGTNDLNGHGTHVAGTIAAIDNNQGVVGMAAGAQVVGVKVCDSGGGCWASNVKAGVDYVADRFSSGDVVNISLGYHKNADTDIPLSDLDNSITTAANSGLKFTISAGNSSNDANNYSPARVENSNVWTVSAFDNNDQFALFSNYGNPPIEYGGPGVDVLSLWKDGGTNTISGTSMSAPHIAGLLLAAPQDIDTDGTVSGDSDNNPDPIAVADLPLKVTIGGPSTLNAGQTGYFTAHVSNPEGPVSLQWYYRNSPGDSWKTGGTGADFQHSWNTADSDAAVKVEVNSAGESDTDIHDVYITCPSGMTVNSTDPEDIDPC